MIAAASALLATTVVDARPAQFIAASTQCGGQCHVTTLTNTNMGTIMGKTSLTTPGTKCAIAYTSGTKDGTNYVIGTEYVFTVTTDDAAKLGMVTSVGEGTAGTAWAQDGTSGRVASKTVIFTPTTAGPMSVHALCGGNSATPLYLATPLSGTIVAANAPAPAPAPAPASSAPAPAPASAPAPAPAQKDGKNKKKDKEWCGEVCRDQYISCWCRCSFWLNFALKKMDMCGIIVVIIHTCTYMYMICMYT